MRHKVHGTLVFEAYNINTWNTDRDDGYCLTQEVPQLARYKVQGTRYKVHGTLVFEAYNINTWNTDRDD